MALMPILIAGCNKEKKVVLQGERETIFLEELELKADVEESAVMVQLPTAIQNKEWPMASGSATHAMPPLTLSENLQEVWSRRVGKGSGSNARLLNGPISAERKVFTVDTNGLITAVDLRTGDIVWEANSIPDNKSSQRFSGGLAYENGYLFCATPAAEIVMLDAKNGQILKRFSLTAPVRAAPTVKNKHIYAVTINNHLEVIQYETGEPGWSHSGMIESAGLLGGTSPAISEDVVVVPYTSGEVYALRVDNGAVLWSESLASFQRLDPVSSLFHIKARPVIHDGIVYLISHGGQMKALDLYTGEALWLKEVGGIRSPAVAGDYIFMVTTDNDLTCLNRHTGKVIWVNRLPLFTNADARTGKILWAGPVLANDRLIITGSNQTLLLVSPQDGKILQSRQLAAPGLLSPIIVDQTLISLTNNAELTAFR
jgi:outer membrane protein assembly factor BamB